MKILIVEDDELIANALANVLTNQNYAVEVAYDGQTAWGLVESFDYDLILLDVMLPQIDGISLCRQIRSKGLQMPILLLTGCDSSHEKAIGLDAGADDYLVKPFDEEELVARIRALLRRGGFTLQPVLQWGNLYLDPTSCETTYGDKHLSLTPKEYSLLELFLRNSRRVFSCGMILEHLWSYEDTPGEEAVRTHIKGLRQKLKAVGAPGDLIETVYGIGYRLKPQTEGIPDQENQKSGDQHKSVTDNDEKAKDEDAKQVPSLSLAQQTLVGVAAIWDRFKERVQQQVALLEQTADAASQKELNQKLRKQAEQEAHTLAGSLGTFGLAEGSKLARQIEKLLKSSKALKMAEISQLSSCVKQLRQEIEQHQREQIVTSPSVPDERPLLLVVDPDRTLGEEIAQESNNWGLKTAIATNIETARNKLYQEHPSVVLLDPSVSSNHQESLSLLCDLNNRKPPVPVLIFTEQSDFENRLQLARQGGHTFLQKPLPIIQVLEAAAKVLQQAPHPEAHILAVDDDPKIGALLQTLLAPWGIKVTTLEDPQNFWEKLETVTPDMLILDVELPKVSGIEICQVVRNDTHWCELPILFLTVHSDADILNQVFTVGADDFVSKPIVGPELITRIINRLERIKLRRHIAYVKGSQQQESGRLKMSINRHLPTQEAKTASSYCPIPFSAAEPTTELTRMNEQLRSELNELQRTQAELRNSEARLAGIVSLADDAIISIDENQNITLFNHGAEKIFGYSVEEVLGQPLDLLLPLQSVQAHRQYVEEFGRSAKVTRRMGERREIYGRRKDGTEFPAEASISKFKTADGVLYTVYLQDISDRKQIEQMKDEFVSVVSHELRTPLTSIHGSLGMLSSGLIKPESEQGKRLLQIAVDSTERLVRLINDILDIERIESGKVKMEKQTCDVAELINEAVNIMQPIADKANVTLSVTSVSEKLWADPDRVVQTLTNLLSNAIKFSQPGSTVWLSAKEQEPQKEQKRESTQTLPVERSPMVLFQVKDTGRGIPENKISSIFERFQQVDSSDSRNHDGTGLGLAICKSIVQQHNGRIWVDSILGKGSSFYFTIPLSSVAVSRSCPLLPLSASPYPPLVLVCDDDPFVRNELQSLLERRNYRVITVESGEEAIKNAASLHPDVILLDLLMPGMNGWETLAVLKQREDTQNIPVIICSVYTPTESSPSSMDFVDWVSKPLEESLLLQSLRQALTNSSKRVRVLVVEDDPDLAKVLITLLENHEMETFCARTGREAIRLSQDVNPDLMILDLVLPEGDGFTVVEWLQQHNRLYQVPLMVYSAKELDESERRRLKLGYTEFLNKGQVTAQEFEQRVMDLLQRITQSTGQDGSNDDKADSSH